MLTIFVGIICYVHICSSLGIEGEKSQEVTIALTIVLEQNKEKGGKMKLLWR